MTETEQPIRKPIIVCLCGSTRFSEVFRYANFEETMAGRIVLSIGCNLHIDDDLFGNLDSPVKQAIKMKLDQLHRRKIDLADEVLILNVGGYIGESTSEELTYAKAKGKLIRYLEKIP